jgi:hypothetical protein
MTVPELCEFGIKQTAERVGFEPLNAAPCLASFEQKALIRIFDFLQTRINPFPSSVWLCQSVQCGSQGQQGSSPCRNESWRATVDC